MAREELKNSLAGDTTGYIPNSLIKDTRISVGSRLLFVYLAGQKNSFIFKNSNIATTVGIGTQTVSDYVTELKKYGWIIKKKTPQGYDTIELCPTSQVRTSKKDILKSLRNWQDLKTILIDKIDGYNFSMPITKADFTSSFIEISFKNEQFYYPDEPDIEIDEVMQDTYWEYLYSNKLNTLLDWVGYTKDPNAELKKKKAKEKTLKLPRGVTTKEQRLDIAEREKKAYIWEAKQAMFQSDKIIEWLEVILQKAKIIGHNEALSIEKWKKVTKNVNPYPLKMKNGTVTIETEQIIVPWLTYPVTICSIISKDYDIHEQDITQEDIEILQIEYKETK